MAAATGNQKFTVAVRAARRAHRDKLEHTCARHCRMSPGLYVMHKSLERLAAAPRSQGIPSLRHPETGASCTTDEAKAAALVDCAQVDCYGVQSLCAGLGAPDLWWGDSRLPTADTVKYFGLRLESSGGWAAQQAAGAANGWAALHQWLPVLRSRHLSAGTKLLVLRSRIAPCMSYGMELWRPSKRGANMTAVLVRAANHISGICRETSHTAFFMGRSVNQDVMLADLDVLSADDHCRMAHARQYALQAAAATAAALYTVRMREMTRVRLSLTPSCLLHMHRITWELLLGMVCTPGMAGSASRARAMTRPYHTAFALSLH